MFFVVLTTFGRSGMTTSHSIALGDWETTRLAATSPRAWVESDRVKAGLRLLKIINDLTAAVCISMRISHHRNTENRSNSVAWPIDTRNRVVSDALSHRWF